MTINTQDATIAPDDQTPDGALVRFVKALARQHAREDHEAAKVAQTQTGGDE